MHNHLEHYPQNADQLLIVPYPNSLRSDDKAATYVDHVGNTYLVPITRHDFELTKMLHDMGLSSGDVVEIPEVGRAVKYGPDTELLPLTALFNSSLESDEARNDVVLSLKLVQRFLNKVPRTHGISPATITMDSFAIDKGHGMAELLPPYLTVPDSVSASQLMDQLKSDILRRSVSDAQSAVLEQCFKAAVEHLDS